MTTVNLDQVVEFDSGSKTLREFLASAQAQIEALRGRHVTPAQRARMTADQPIDQYAAQRIAKALNAQGKYAPAHFFMFPGSSYWTAKIVMEVRAMRLGS
jgi:hypothetical protein